MQYQTDDIITIPTEDYLALYHPVRDWNAWLLYSSEMREYRAQMGLPQPPYPGEDQDPLTLRLSKGHPDALEGRARPRSRRGGKRPGAGAPRGNLNALRHGGRSKRIARGCLVLALIPEVLDALRVIKANTSDPAAYERKLAESIEEARHAILADPELTQSTADLILSRYRDALRQIQNQRLKANEKDGQSNNQTLSNHEVWRRLLTEGSHLV